MSAPSVTALRCNGCGAEATSRARLAGHLMDRHHLLADQAVVLAKRIERATGNGVVSTAQRPVVIGRRDEKAETRAKRSAAAKQRWADPAARAKLSAAAKTPERRAAASARMKRTHELAKLAAARGLA